MQSTSRNDHLSVVFTQMLPALEQAGLGYWVYGGIGVAGAVGRFIRQNGDVDIYVLSKDFDAVTRHLAQLCDANAWQPVDKTPLRGRPKFEVHVDGNELLSVVPVYETADGVDFRANTPVRLVKESALRQERRHIDEFSFFSPPASVLKAILRSLLIEQPVHLTGRSPRSADAATLFSEKELNEIKRDVERRDQLARSRRRGNLA